MRLPNPRQVLLQLGGLLVAGAVFAAWLVRRADLEFRADVIQRAQLVAEAVDTTSISSFTGTPADLTNPQYSQLEQQLRLVRTLYPQCRFAYIMGRKADGTIFIYVDSELPGSKAYSPPGQVFTQATPRFRGVFDTNTPVAEGPIADEWGMWISGLIPLTDSRTGKIVAMLGMDVDSQVWRAALFRAAAPAGLVTLVLASILVGGSVLLARRATIVGMPAGWRRHLELGLVGAVGLTLTLTAAWLAYTAEVRQRYETFERLATSQAARVVERLKNIRNHQLESLALYYMADEEVTNEEFQLFAESLTSNPVVASWIWIPAVPAAEREAFEASIRSRGQPDFQIWELDARGQRVPAAGRAIFYPISAMAPHAENAEVLGYDAISNRQRRSAMEEASDTGLATATDPVTLVRHANSNRTGMLIYRPVFSTEGPRRLRGFVGAALQMKDLLQGGTTAVGPQMEIALLRAKAAPELLATNADEAAAKFALRSTPRPFFAFGKVFFVTVSEPSGLAPENPLRAGVLALLTGLTLTGTIMTIVRLTLRQRARLESLVTEQTRDLRARTAFLEALVDASVDGILVVDSAGRKVLQNRQMGEVWKIPAEIAQDPDDSRQIRFVTERTKTPEEFIAKVRHLYSHPNEISRDIIELRDGSVLDRYAAPVIDAQGQHHGRIWSFRDITERKRAAMELEAAHRTLQERIKEVNCLYSILKLTERSGATIGELLGSAVELIPPAWQFPAAACARIICDGREYLSSGFSPARWGLSTPIVVAGRAVGLVEVCYREDDREWHEDPFLKEERALVGNLATQFSFMIERKRTEEKLSQLSSIIEQAPLSVVITNLARVIEYVNPKFCAVTGYAPGEFIGQPFALLWSDEMPPDVLRDLAGTVADGQVWTGEVRSRRKNGDSYLENVVVAPLTGDDGRVTHYVALKDDITAQKRFEAETTAMLQQERKISEMKSQFISVTSHEFRTPLAAAVGSLELLERHADKMTAAKRSEMMTRIQRSLARLTEIINQVLNISRVESGRVAVKRQPVDLGALAQDAIREVEIGDRQQHRFVYEQTGGPAVVPTDPSLLHHVLSNLLGNAVRYSPAGTTVTVNLELGEREFVLTVADEGIGIPEAEREGIFQPFIRGTNVGQISGTGLGLNIVKRYVALMGGSIKLISSERGAKFQVRVPSASIAT